MIFREKACEDEGDEEVPVGNWMLSLGDLERGAVLTWPLKDFIQGGRTFLRPESSPIGEQKAWDIYFCHNLDEVEVAEVIWRGPAFACTSKFPPPPSVPAAGEPPPHSLKVEVCAEIVSGRYMSPQVAAARQGFRNISKAQLAQILRDTGEAVDETLSEYDIVLQAFNAFHPEVDEQLMFQYLAARAHHSKRIVGESFFNEESVKCCFDESDL